MGDKLLANYKFSITIGGFESAGFSTCSGLSATAEYDTIHQGGGIAPIHLFKKLTFPPVTLTQGITIQNGTDSYWWFESAVRQGTFLSIMNPRNIFIDAQGVTYLLLGARVKQIDFGNFSANGRSASVSKLVLIHRGIERFIAPGASDLDKTLNALGRDIIY